MIARKHHVHKILLVKIEQNIIAKMYVSSVATQKSLSDNFCMSLAAENLGFPPREQLKRIVKTMEVLAYKAVSSAMDHFALGCVRGCICLCMCFTGMFVCVLFYECP